MIDLSIIIVNYNVKYFVQQCIESCIRASQNIKTEIIVVDNNSSDGSIDHLKNHFESSITLIANDQNLGFSKANNIGIQKARAPYILLLNPDTLVQEDTFEKCLEFYKTKKDAGAIGVRMIDGSGTFLKESKRGFPSPLTAFYKITGLSKLFPKSKTFSKYHLGYLDEFKVHQVDVLSGAFMMLRKETLNAIGLLDEDFFMYGEDIDLSYRVQKGGFKNYYLPSTTIIHYKGESTKKTSINYLMVFYKAMIIFARKHLASQSAFLYQCIIYPAIYFTGFVAFLHQSFKKYLLLIIDLLLLGMALFWFKDKYAELNHIIFKPTLVYTGILTGLVIWSGTMLLGKAYKRPIDLTLSLKYSLLGSLIILSFYSILPEYLRFSRAVLLFGAFSYLIIILCSRILLSHLLPQQYTMRSNTKDRIAIVANKQDLKRIEKSSSLNSNLDCLIPVSFQLNDLKENNSAFFSEISKLKELTTTMHINKIIFCMDKNEISKIIRAINSLEDLSIEIQIAHMHEEFVIGNKETDKVTFLNVKN